MVAAYALARGGWEQVNLASVPSVKHVLQAAERLHRASSALATATQRHQESALAQLRSANRRKELNLRELQGAVDACCAAMTTKMEEMRAAVASGDVASILRCRRDNHSHETARLRLQRATEACAPMDVDMRHMASLDADLALVSEATSLLQTLGQQKEIEAALPGLIEVMYWREGLWAMKFG